jgi:hypothetical protein
MSVLLSVERFLLHNALEKNRVIDLVTAYIAVVVIAYFDKPKNTCDLSTRTLSIEKELSAREFVRRQVSFGDLDAITKKLRDADQVRILVNDHTHYTLKQDMMGYELIKQQFPPPMTEKEDVVMYLLRHVPVSCVHALVTACFYAINVEKITEDLREQLRAASQTPSKWDQTSDEGHLMIARTLRSKRLACVHALSAESSMVNLKGALEKILVSSVKVKKIDETFLTLPEGMTFRDGLYIECRVLRAGAQRREDLWGLKNQPVITSRFKVRCLIIDESKQELTEVQTEGSDDWVKVSLDLELF